MPTYIFRCHNCGTRYEAQTPDLAGETLLECDFCNQPMLRRDYRAEGVGFAVAKLSRERTEGTDTELRDLFLETAAEAATPDDPDGSIAIREWNETHEPFDGEAKALRPEMPLHTKKVL